ncbi:3349_t:CDS:2 [Funneliformis geosporum]|nr:3349_t:CDS:2 [Funneliformis geosporum]
MGNLSSSLDEHPTLYIRNSNRFHITEIVVSNSAHDPYITFPIESNGITATSNTTDLLEFIQDPNAQSIIPNKFLLKLIKDKKLELKFKFNIGETDGNKADVKGLTFINVASERELARILTVEFNDDPNLHKHPNVTLVGNYESDGIKTSENEWTWKWSPPHNMDEVHRDNTFTLLASFTFWVADTPRNHYHRASRSSGSVDGVTFFPIASSLLPPSQNNTLWSLGLPRSIRPSSPDNVYLPVPGLSSHTSGTASSVSSGGRRSSDDLMFQHEPEDGPLFRATLTSFEKKTGSLKHHIKRILKTATASHDVLMECHETEEEFLSTIKAASVAHPQAFQPILDNYFEDASKKVAAFRESLANQMSVLLIEPLRKLYENDIKVAESKKKDFEEESRDYYQFLSKYLSLTKEKKKLESDTKYQSKRKNFELKRFDYYAYMQDLHGGRKDQEILYHLTNFAEKQFAFFQQSAGGILSLKPGLDKLAVDVAEATKEIHLMRKEREERRRALETRATTVNPFTSESFNEVDSNGGNGSNTSDNMSDVAENQTASPVGSPNVSQNRFKGIRDLEQHDSETASVAGRKKEGFLFATSRATQHGTVDSISKTSWHKYWCVLAGGQLCEYSNWKKQLEAHNDPINLRFAAVREARGIERRFCFEIITPQYRRIYQATSAEDMSSWINVISNAIESLLNGTSSCRNLDQVMAQDSNGAGAGELFKKPIQRRGTLPSLTDKRKVDMKKGLVSSGSEEITSNNQSDCQQEINESEKSARVLESIKGADPSNASCADCGARKTEWCSINLGIVLCIECSGIHRSLGTHISKIRSLTLDTTSYTPDLVNLIKSIGNARSNAIWEATLEQRQIQQKIGTLSVPLKFEAPSVSLKNDDSFTDADWEDLINLISPSNHAPTVKKHKGITKPNSTDSRDIKKKFITAKYVDRVFVDLSLTDEDKTATDILFEAVKTNDIPLAMQAIALKADVNSARRFEVADDHGLKTPLLLALLHIDSTLVTNEGGKILFPMAELLLQNGAYIEKVLFDNLDDMLGAASTPITRSSAKSVGAWATEVVNDMKKSGKSAFDVVQASGDIAAIRYLTPKVLARGAASTLNSGTSITTTSTGGVVGGSIIEKKPSSNIGRSISISVKNVLS